MELITSPYFAPSKRDYRFSEVKELLDITSQSMTDLTTNCILCKSYKIAPPSGGETLFHSALDIVAAHLYLTVATEFERAPTRHMLGVLAVTISEDYLRHIETRQPPSCPVELETQIRSNRTMSATGMDKYRSEIAKEILLFWRKLREHITRFGPHQSNRVQLLVKR